VSNGRSGCSMGARGLTNRWFNTRRDILYNILCGGFGFERIDLASRNMLRLFDFGVICYEIKNSRYILMWLATLPTSVIP
jgi:hypothetical protein